MSGKCVSIVAVSLLALGSLVAFSVILFQEDTSDPSVVTPERSYKPNWENKVSLNSLASQSPTSEKPQNSHPRNPSRRKPIVNATVTENSYSTPSAPSTLMPPSLSSPLSTPKPPQVLLTIQRDVQRPVSLEDLPDRKSASDLRSVERPPYEFQQIRPYVGYENEPGYDDTYTEDEPSSDFEEDANLGSSEFNELLELAKRLYRTDLNVTDFQGFLQIVNETINRGSGEGFLNHLNQLYSRPGITTELMDDNQDLDETDGTFVSVGRNAYESSLTAFAFMSFGVFLLKQIHNLIGKTTETVEGRQLGTPPIEPANLNLLFNPPSFSDSDEVSPGPSSRQNAENPTEMNNMFRAMLNLVNAYTKDSQALECIWASYCQDLDKTSGNEGLYGLAARINSIGLRLIMHQISAELTLDVLLRSLLGWDGLPCKKMFPQCEPANATLTLRSGTVGNAHVAQMKLPTTLQE